jgi:superfamily II DNA or RNA helicase
MWKNKGYLGPKGYTIYKKELTLEEIQTIKKELTVQPQNHGSPVQDQSITFPVYRESPQKIYMPYYYGLEKGGPPLRSDIPEGDAIDITFRGTLRDYQIPVVNKFLSTIKKGEKSGGLLELFCAWGKTSASLYILTKIAKKTLVIVHKEFLMNQWIERIQQFIPEARIGKIQGPTIDIENKDIVLCMLQSLVQKEYPSSTFESFGFTIIDEVHHISSQTFSHALFKIVTPHMLGLSATMERKDGTTRIFKYFLGDIVHKAVKTSDATVEVHYVPYRVTDEDFNETVTDFRGQPQLPTMISKLCSYNRRTEFILSTLDAFLQKEGERQEKKANSPCQLCLTTNYCLMQNTCCGCIAYCMPCLESIVQATKTKRERPKCPQCCKVLQYDQQPFTKTDPSRKTMEEAHIIVMSHNLNVLEYMYRAIVCRNMTSVGYYVGGMKEAELKRSEKRQVILATYSMCSEGLDIPSLNTEFLITPKTDVVQIVGRILRAKHTNANPTIFDFVDKHDVFQRQWQKRRAYYKKQGFTIHSLKMGQKEEEEEEDKKDLPSRCMISLKTLQNNITI